MHSNSLKCSCGNREYKEKKETQLLEKKNIIRTFLVCSKCHKKVLVSKLTKYNLQETNTQHV